MGRLKLWTAWKWLWAGAAGGGSLESMDLLARSANRALGHGKVSCSGAQAPMSVQGHVCERFNCQVKGATSSNEMPTDAPELAVRLDLVGRLELGPFLVSFVASRGG